MGLSYVLQKFEPSDFDFITFFQIQEPPDPDFEPISISCHTAYSAM